MANKVLTYGDIINMIKKYSDDIDEFDSIDYKKIKSSRITDTVLDNILNKYPPTGFELLYRNARRKFDWEQDYMRKFDHIPDQSYLEEVKKTRDLFERRTRNLMWTIFPTFSHGIDYYKQQVLLTFEAQLQDNLIAYIYYPDATKDELEEKKDELSKHGEDFRDFLDDYIFDPQSNIDPNVVKTLAQGISWCKNELDPKKQPEALKVLFYFLNLARLDFEHRIKRGVQFFHTTDEDKKSLYYAWRAEKKILEGVTYLRLSSEFDIKNRYVQALIDDFVVETTDGLQPSEELYAIYLNARMPSGWSWSRAEVSDYCSEEHHEQSVLLKNSTDCSLISYQNLLFIAKTLLKCKEESGEESCFKAILRELRYPTTQGEHLFFQFFPNMGKNERDYIKAILECHYRSKTQSSTCQQENSDISLLVKKIKAFFFETSILNLLNPFKSIDYYFKKNRERFLSSQKAFLILKSSSQKILILKDSESNHHSIKEFLTNHSSIDASLTRSRIQEQTGITENWLILLEDIFNAQNKNVWSICENFLTLGVSPASNVDQIYLQEYITKRIKILNDLAHINFSKKICDFFFCYTINKPLVDILKNIIIQKINHISDRHLDNACPEDANPLRPDDFIPCNEEIFIEVLNEQIWDRLTPKLKNIFACWLMQNCYEKALLHPSITMNEITSRALFFYNAINFNYVKLVKRFLDETEIDLTGSSSYDKSPIERAVGFDRAEILSLMLKKITVPQESKNSLLLSAIITKKSQSIKILLENGADPHCKMYSVDTLFMTALDTGCPEVIDALLQSKDLSKEHINKALIFFMKSHKADLLAIIIKKLNCRGQKFKDSLLIWAIKKDSALLIQELLLHGASTKQHIEGRTLLSFSLEKKLFNAAIALIRSVADLKPQDKHDAIVCAIKEKLSHFAFGCLERFLEFEHEDEKLFLDLSINTMQTELVSYFLQKEGACSLDRAYSLMPILESDHHDLAILLLEHDVKTSQDDKNLALIWAAKNGQIKLVELLLKKGASIYVKIDEKQNILEFAIEEANTNLLTVIVLYASDIKYLDKVKAILWFVKTENSDFLINILNKTTHQLDLQLVLIHGLQTHKPEVVGLAIEYGADVNQYDNQFGTTPFTLALEQGSPAEITNIIKKSNNLSQRHQNILLMWCIENGRSELALSLLEQGADSNFKVKTSETMLILAIKKRQYPVVAKLIRKDADITEKSKDGDSPFSLALKLGHYFIAALLLIELIKYLGTFFLNSLKKSAFTTADRSTRSYKTVSWEDLEVIIPVAEEKKHALEPDKKDVEKVHSEGTPNVISRETPSKRRTI